MSDQVDMVTAQETTGAAGGDENAPVEPVTPAAAAEAAPVADAVLPATPIAEEDAPDVMAISETAVPSEPPVAEAALPETPVGEEEVAPETTVIPETAVPSEPPVAEAALPETPVGEEEVAPEASVVPETAAPSEPPVAEAALPETPAADDSVAPEVVAAPEAVTPSVPPVAARPEEEASEADSGKRQVRVLSVGQEVLGTVKRIAEFGAFIDIGVGRDGLIHISELSVRRVGKVTDVLSEGQEVTAWIKKLDRDRNRISLTLVNPETKTIRDLEKDELVQGVVTRILPYGAFVDIGIGRDALLHVREMAEGFVAKPEDVITVGETIEARIIELSRRRGRVDLSLKGLRPEPEAPAAHVAPSEPAVASAPEPEEQGADIFEDSEVLSPMELAFKRAMEAEGFELNVSKKKQGKRNRHERNRSIQDEIIARTLDSGKK